MLRGAAAAARDDMGNAAGNQYKLYNIQRQYMAFLEALDLREEFVPEGRGEVEGRGSLYRPGFTLR